MVAMSLFPYITYRTEQQR